LRVPLATLALGVYGQFDFHLLSFLALRRAPAVEANLVNDLWPLPIVVLAPLLLCGLRLAPRHVVAASFGSTQTLHQARPEFGSGSPYVTLRDAMRGSTVCRRLRPNPPCTIGLRGRRTLSIAHWEGALLVLASAVVRSGYPPLPTPFLIATWHGHCSGTITLAAALITGGTVLGSRR
jgi:drug/metabolite transporter (DMT)-like permease